jgi:pilus assembly protein CpaC
MTTPMTPDAIIRRARKLATASLAAAFLAVAAVPVASTPADAQTRQLRLAGGQAQVSVVQRTSQTLRTDQAFTDVVVADPDIADAVPLTDRSIYVLGKKVGVTSVSVYDADKKLVGVMEVDVTQNAARAGADIRRNVEGPVRARAEAGKIVLDGNVKDAVQADRAARIARAHGGDVVNQMRVQGPQQVMLEVRFIEVSRNAGRDLGVRIGVRGDGVGTGVGGGSGKGQIGVLGFAANATALANPVGAAPFGTLIAQLTRGGTNIDVIIQALEEQGVARRLAEPNLITMSGEKASFLAGGEIPIPVQQSFGVTTVDYKKVGVGLVFTPTVLSQGMINLRIEPEVSNIDASGGTTIGGLTIPRISVSRASTVVELKSGQSFAIAGLLQSTTTSIADQLPWAGDLPVIGALFRSRSFQQKETELAIIVTPHLVQPARPGQKLKTPHDNTRPGNDADQFLIGRSEVPRDGHRRRGPIEPVAAPARQAATGHILDFPGVSNGTR